VSRRPVTVLAAVLSAAALAGCGTGLHAKTYQEHGREDSARTEQGAIAVRNVYAEAPASGDTLTQGGTAVLHGTFVNTGSSADALVGAASDAAASAQLQLDAKPATSIPLPAGQAAAGDVTVVFTFQNAGRTEQVQVPLRTGDSGLQDRTPAQDPYGEK
jgi:outer membrane murein-binding lipoprotein Lpp